MANKRGIDVSSHNGQVDWEKAKAAGLDFAILRCGWGVDRDTQDDSTFARNVSECDRLGIPWGAYLYSYAMSIDEAKSEAEHIKRLLKGKKPLYPVLIDMEDTDGYKAQRGGNTRQMNTDIIKTVCQAFGGRGILCRMVCKPGLVPQLPVSGAVGRLAVLVCALGRAGA